MLIQYFIDWKHKQKTMHASYPLCTPHILFYVLPSMLHNHLEFMNYKLY